MPNYRRVYLPGGTFFFTIVTEGRYPLFDADANVLLLRAAVAATREEKPFQIVAAVVLPDHLHFIWTLPDDDSDYSWRIGRMKALFTKSLKEVGPTLRDSVPHVQSRDVVNHASGSGGSGNT
jgi:putative transposase